MVSLTCGYGCVLAVVSKGEVYMHQHLPTPSDDDDGDEHSGIGVEDMQQLRRLITSTQEGGDEEVREHVCHDQWGCALVCLACCSALMAYARHGSRVQKLPALKCRRSLQVKACQRVSACKMLTVLMAPSMPECCVECVIIWHAMYQLLLMVSTNSQHFGVPHPYPCIVSCSMLHEI